MKTDETFNFISEIIEASINEVLMIDPPSGWMYGYPKAYFKNKVDSENELNQWLINNNYPSNLIEQYKDGFPCRFWYKPI